MNENRTMVTYAMRAPVVQMLLGTITNSGVTAGDGTLIPEAVLWQIRTSSSWCDFLERFGKCSSVFPPFLRRARAGVSGCVINALSEGCGLGHVFVDGTAVQAHRKTAAAERGLCRQGTVRSRGGLLGRVAGVADALGYWCGSLVSQR